jgi:hypothetical protein
MGIRLLSGCNSVHLWPEGSLEAAPRRRRQNARYNAVREDTGSISHLSQVYFSSQFLGRNWIQTPACFASVIHLFGSDPSLPDHTANLLLSWVPGFLS